MRSFHKKALTLIELLIAISLLSLIVIGFSSIELFSHYQVISSDRRAGLQNEVSYALDHMAKHISQAAGNRIIAGQEPIYTNLIGGRHAIEAHIDTNRDGQGDRWIAYRLVSNSGTPSEEHRILYCPDCPDAACAACNVTEEVVCRRTQTFNIDDSAQQDYVRLRVTSRWEVGDAVSVDNPEVTMRANIRMPAVSTN
jgi:prepilin-type N-terminal cleavage/methylation domain-containing protein